MATKKPVPSSEATETKPGTALINWEEQMAADAALSAKMEESTATGAFFKTKAGILSWNDAPVNNNQLATVILDSILVNVSHDGVFDDDNPRGARCFAFGRDDADMKPHASVVAAGMAVSETCADCPRNVFGSADVGKGKACKNTRRLALAPAGTLDGNNKFTAAKNESEIREATIGFLQLPVTSVRPYSAFVKQVAGSLKRPPHGIFTKIKAQPDTKTQFKITAEPLGLVPNNLMSAVMEKRSEATLSIEQPYALDEEFGQEPSPKNRARKPAAKSAPAKKQARKF